MIGRSVWWCKMGGGDVNSSGVVGIIIREHSIMVMCVLNIIGIGGKSAEIIKQGTHALQAWRAAQPALKRVLVAVSLLYLERGII